MYEYAFREGLYNRTQVNVTEEEVRKIAGMLRRKKGSVYKLHHHVAFSHWDEMPDEFKNVPISWIGGLLKAGGKDASFKSPTLLTVPVASVGGVTPMPQVVDLRHVRKWLPVNPQYFHPGAPLYCSNGGG